MDDKDICLNLKINDCNNFLLKLKELQYIDYLG